MKNCSLSFFFCRDHSEDRKVYHEYDVMKEQKVIVGFLLEWARLREEGFTEDEVNMVTSMLSTHSLKWMEVGRGMFPTFAFMSHSCNYNARHVIQSNNHVQVKFWFQSLEQTYSRVNF